MNWKKISTDVLTDIFIEFQVFLYVRKIEMIGAEEFYFERDNT